MHGWPFFSVPSLYIESTTVLSDMLGVGQIDKNRILDITLCSARNVIECAFGRLKARFGCLKRAMDINSDDLPFVIYACFVLHNYCELNNESINKETIRMTINYDHDFQPLSAPNRYTSSNETEGKRIRRIHVLTNYFDP